MWFLKHMPFLIEFIQPDRVGEDECNNSNILFSSTGTSHDVHLKDVIYIMNVSGWIHRQAFYSKGHWQNDKFHVLNL